MNGFSIDLASERIVDQRTREYFTEVARSFSNDCFRSSVVMLWSVVICDLIYKLEILRDMHSDQTARKLLEDVEARQAASPNNPDWETFLLDEINKRTRFLEAGEYVQLQHLQKLRHLSAHPVIQAGSSQLFSPTKETTRAAIRNAMEAVLLRPPLFSKKIASTFVDDIATNKDVLMSKQALKSYLEARYFPNIQPDVERELFRTLWKFCFKLKNSDTDANRDINVAALGVMYERNPSEYRNAVASDPTFFSDIASAEDMVRYCANFLSDHPELYASLNNAAKVILRARIDADVNLLARAAFISGNVEEHLDLLLSKPYEKLRELDSKSWNSLVANAIAGGFEQKVYDIAVKIYICSGGYDAADANFTRFIGPHIESFDEHRLKSLLEGIEDNGQTYGRSRSKRDHKLIEDRMNIVGSLQAADYPHFVASLN